MALVNLDMLAGGLLAYWSHEIGHVLAALALGVPIVSVTVAEAGPEHPAQASWRMARPSGDRGWDAGESVAGLVRDPARGPVGEFL
jgi:hypothetical protein